MVVCLGIACQGAIVRKNFARNLENSLNVLHEWKYIDYDFGSEERRQAAIQSGEYDHTKNYPFDVDQWRGKIFLF